jgi:PST family polysaccharide transporter
VAFPALSRVQAEPRRFRSYFLTIYSLFLSIALPITVACALFADDIVMVFLGPKWHEAASVFRLLAPTILSFAVINPFGWLMFASGRVVRSLKIALMIGPVTILSYVLGLAYGAKGVAVGFSLAMILLTVPVVLWAKRDTLITARDAFNALAQPGGAILAGVAVALVAGPWVNQVAWPLLKLTIACSLMFGTYLAVLLFVLGQGRIYVQLLQETRLWPSWLRQPPVSGG